MDPYCVAIATLPSCSIGRRPEWALTCLTSPLQALCEVTSCISQKHDAKCNVSILATPWMLCYFASIQEEEGVYKLLPAYNADCECKLTLSPILPALITHLNTFSHTQEHSFMFMHNIEAHLACRNNCQGQGMSGAYWVQIDNAAKALECHKLSRRRCTVCNNMFCCAQGIYFHYYSRAAATLHWCTQSLSKAYFC